MTIPIEFVALFLGCVVTAMGWLIKWLVQAIATVNVSLQWIEKHLGTLNGRVGAMEARHTMHEKSDDERHEHVDKSIDALWKKVNA